MPRSNDRRLRRPSQGSPLNGCHPKRALRSRPLSPGEAASAWFPRHMMENGRRAPNGRIGT
jgi:hypothetical protein